MTPFVRSDIKGDEAPGGIAVLDAYADPETHGAPWTIGFGHTGLEVHPGLTWTPEQAEAAFEADFDRTVRTLDAKLPWWRNLNDARQDVFANMAFNMGVGYPPVSNQPGEGLRGFAKAVAAAKRNDFIVAAAEFRDSHWFHQVGNKLGQRGFRLTLQFETGERA